jgi:hypothetical protein
MIITWAQSAQLNLDPPLPKILRGRLADNWRVLISIADSFNNKRWSEAAREAAITYANGYHDEDACVMLLYDIRTIFRRLNVDRIKSVLLAEKLHELEDGVGVWSAWRGVSDDRPPHPITQGEIATLLRRFNRDLRPRPLFERGSHQTGSKAGRGYYVEQFEKWWDRYCPEDGEATTDNVRQLHVKSNVKAKK